MSARLARAILSVNLEATVIDSSTGANAPIGPALPPIRLSSGIGYDQADLCFEATRTLAASANEDLNLYNGFTDGLGNTVTLAKVKTILIVNHSTSQVLAVEAGSADPFSSFVTGTSNSLNIPKAASDANPGVNFWHNPQGVAIASGSSKINVANPSGASATYSIYVIGTSA